MSTGSELIQLDCRSCAERELPTRSYPAVDAIGGCMSVVTRLNASLQSRLNTMLASQPVSSAIMAVVRP